TLKLKTNIGKYKFVQSNNNDILITNNEIILNNIESPSVTAPQESPENWFIWGSNGTQINGLSATGLNQKRIALPSKATSITNTALYNNEKLVSVDMSLTSITSIPNGTYGSSGTFRNDSNLISISLPPYLTSIGYTAFWSCSSLISITIPDLVNSIASDVFNSCSSLTSITMPNSVTSIGIDAFYNVPSTCTMYVSSTWNKTLATKARYSGTFSIIENI
ncbi:MAG: leucine-rich repeat domain-containing protein, partial [Ureaplasma sp.]|nr:leucine-rich repeat domain-containing protein [Ureaplasma sp.]